MVQYYDSADDETLETEMLYEIGFFISEYSSVEILITILLAAVSGFHDLESFHILTKGMDAPTKVARLRELTKENDLIAPKGDLEKRLIYFGDAVSSLRNKIAHSWLVRPKDEPARVTFGNIAQLPFDLFKMGKRQRRKPQSITLDELDAFSHWLNDFQRDLVSVTSLVKSYPKIELKNPRSLEPTAFQKQLEQLAQNAKNHKQKPLQLK